MYDAINFSSVKFRDQGVFTDITLLSKMGYTKKERVQGFRNQ